MNEVEKMATEMSEKKKRPLRCIARDHEWLMPCYRFSDNGFKRQIGKMWSHVLMNPMNGLQEQTSLRRMPFIIYIDG